VVYKTYYGTCLWKISQKLFNKHLRVSDRSENRRDPPRAPSEEDQVLREAQSQSTVALDPTDPALEFLMDVMLKSRRHSFSLKRSNHRFEVQDRLHAEHQKKRKHSQSENAMTVRALKESGHTIQPPRQAEVIGGLPYWIWHKPVSIPKCYPLSYCKALLQNFASN